MSAYPGPLGVRGDAQPRLRMGGRPALWLGALVSLTVLLALVAPWAISRGALREEVAAQLRSSAGLYVFPRGDASVSFLPRPRVQFDDIAFVDPTGALVVEARSMTGTIRLLPLLAGRLEVAEIALTAPRMTIDLDRGPMTSAGAAVRAAGAPPGSTQAAKADAARLGIVSMTEGTADLRRRGVSVGTLSHIDARLDWRSVAAPAALTGSLEWAGQRQQLVLWVSTPASLLRGGTSPLTMEIRNPQTSVISAGSVSVANRPQFEGRLRLATSVAPALLGMLGIDAALPPALQDAALDGDLTASPGAATMSNFRLDIGGDQFEGALAWQGGGDRPSLTGTLAAPSLSLAPYVAASRMGEGGTRTTAQPELDLRVSAVRLRYDRLQADDAALSVSSHAGRLEYALADAGAYGGRIKARAVFTTDEAARSQMQVSVLGRGVDWGALDRDLTGQGRISGTADLSLTLRGDMAETMAGELSGQGKLSLVAGEIAGLDVAGALSRLDTRPLAAASDLGSGRTRFDRATLPFAIDRGTAQVTSGEIIAPDYEMTLAGTVQLAGGQTALKASVRPTTGGAAGFGFDVTGPWHRPQFTPDVQGLIRRSGAASPLFVRPTALSDDAPKR